MITRTWKYTHFTSSRRATAPAANGVEALVPMKSVRQVSYVLVVTLARYVDDQEEHGDSSYCLPRPYKETHRGHQ